jgi:hypothetical protein
MAAEANAERQLQLLTFKFQTLDLRFYLQLFVAFALLV